LLFGVVIHRRPAVPPDQGKLPDLGVAVGRPDSPFFASPASTSAGEYIPARNFLNAKSCGNSGCHPDIYKQWLSSAHRFSSFTNPFYRRVVEYQEARGVPRAITRFCGGCHDPAMLFSGQMEDKDELDPEGEEASVGLTCVACHSLVHIKNPKGNATYVIEEPKGYPYTFSNHAWLQKLNSLLMRVKPGPHKQTFLKPLHKRPEFCGACHKVGVPAAANNYRWQRAFSEYDSWQLGGISGQSARSFYNPQEFKTCSDCHMPLVPSRDAGNIEGKVHDHSFPGAHTALPAVRGDKEHLEKIIKFLRQEDWMTIDVFGIRRSRSTTAWAEPGMMLGGARAEELTAPIHNGDALVRGETVRVDVVVRNKGVGHQFTGGTRDAHEPWVELKVTDSKGRIISWSGFMDQEGNVDPKAHFYRFLLIDRAGRMVNKRNAAIDWISTVYGRQIEVGQCDVVHYRFIIPEDSSDEITISAKLHYRKWLLWYHKWVFAGIPDPRDKTARADPWVDERRWIFADKPIPPLPIVTMAEHTVKLKVLPGGSSPRIERESRSPTDRDRFYNYGVGLLIQRDFRGAEAAFRKVIQIDPTYLEGYVSLARTFLEEGHLMEALEQLRKAESLDPTYFKSHYFLGLVYKGLGRYDEALKRLHSVARLFPRDRVVRNQIGRVYFLQRNYRQAVAEFQKTLEIDPEDLVAHYNLMLCYEGLGEKEKAKQHTELYMTYKFDETIKRLTGPYKRQHPWDNNEAQLIHDHTQ